MATLIERMRTASPNLVLFDLDGTLIDSVGDLADAANEVLKEFGRAPRTDREIRNFVGNGVQSLLDRCLVGHMDGGAPQEEIDRAVHRFRTRYLAHCTARTVLLPGAREALVALRSRNIRTGVLTNKPEAPTRRILSHFGIDQLFDGVVGGDTLDVRKPDLRVVHEAYRQCGVATNCDGWFVGDSSTDALTAARAGMTSVIVRGGYNHGLPVEAIRPTPDLIIADLLELATALV